MVGLLLCWATETIEVPFTCFVKEELKDSHDGKVKAFGWASDSYNVAPRAYRPVLHIDGDALFVDDMHWGYRSSWAETSGKIPIAINTRLEKISNRYWSDLLKRGRTSVLAYRLVSMDR